MSVFARQEVSITSSEDGIVIATPETLILNGGGSYLKLSRNGIEHGSSGDYLVKASRYQVPGYGAEMPVDVPDFDVTDITVTKQVTSKSLHD